MSGRRTIGRVATLTSGAAALPGAYLGALTCLAAVPHRCGTMTDTRFAIVVPAHDEADNIEATVASLCAIDYPGDRFSVNVIADNCTDRTADVARAAGAIVHERTDPAHRGKGQALEWAFARLLAVDDVDAVVVVDADTVCDVRLLQCAAHHIADGALALQVDYRVRNPGSTWRTTLLDVAFTAQHRIRSRGRDALALSVGLRGNGMVFTREALQRVPHQAHSAVEDREYGLMLGRAGIRIAGCDGTWVAGDMPDDDEASSAQRVRWELGQREVRKEHLGKLARTALRDADPVAADLAVDVAFPPLSTTVIALAAATAGTAVLRAVGIRPAAALAALTVGWLGLTGHFVAAVAASQSRWSAFPALARIPSFMAWKVGLRRSDRWRDQAREGMTWERTGRSADAAIVTPTAVVA